MTAPLLRDRGDTPASRLGRNGADIGRSARHKVDDTHAVGPDDLDRIVVGELLQTRDEIEGLRPRVGETAAGNDERTRPQLDRLGDDVDDTAGGYLDDEDVGPLGKGRDRRHAGDAADAVVLGIDGVDRSAKSTGFAVLDGDTTDEAPRSRADDRDRSRSQQPREVHGRNRQWQNVAGARGSV